jgi:hypothetical protein
MRQEAAPSSPKAHAEPRSGRWNFKGTRHAELAAQEQLLGAAAFSSVTIRSNATA